MPADDAQGGNRFHVHRYVCLLLDDALNGGLQFVPEPDTSWDHPVSVQRSPPAACLWAHGSILAAAKNQAMHS